MIPTDDPGTTPPLRIRTVIGGETRENRLLARVLERLEFLASSHVSTADHGAGPGVDIVIHVAGPLREPDFEGVQEARWIEASDRILVKVGFLEPVPEPELVSQISQVLMEAADIADRVAGLDADSPLPAKRAVHELVEAFGRSDPVQVERERSDSLAIGYLVSVIGAITLAAIGLLWGRSMTLDCRGTCPGTEQRVELAVYLLIGVGAGTSALGLMSRWIPSTTRGMIVVVGLVGVLALAWWGLSG